MHKEFNIIVIIFGGLEGGLYEPIESPPGYGPGVYSKTVMQAIQLLQKYLYHDMFSSGELYIHKIQLIIIIIEQVKKKLGFAFIGV